MADLRGLLALYRAWRAARHYRLYRRHVVARLALPSEASGAPTAGATRPCPAGTILLACIVGMAICATWIAITWRAAA